MYNLSVLLHKIARWAVPFVNIPADVKKRAAAGLLTPADCQLIAERLAALGRSLATQEDLAKASRMAEQTIRLIRLAQEDDDIRDCLKNVHNFSGKRPSQSYLQFFLSLSSFRDTPN